MYNLKDKKLKIITLANIIKTNSDNIENIFSEFVKLYPDQIRNIEGYKKLYNDLINMINTKKVFRNKENMYISIDYVDEQHVGEKLDPSECYFHVCGVKNPLHHTINKEMKFRGKINYTYCLMFSSHSNWLGFYIDENIRKNYSDIQIICHCLYEMTWQGFSDKEIKKQKKIIDKRIDDFETWTKDDTLDKHTKSSEEVFKKLKLKMLKCKNDKKNTM